MMVIAFSIATCLTLLSPAAVGGAVSLDCKANDNLPWSYHQKTNGPESWGNSFPNCTGKNQSPVHIFDSKVKKNKDLTPLTLTNYNQAVTAAEMGNNGYTVTVTPTDGVERSFELQGTKYVLKFFYFHWGSDDTQGSEHNVNKNKYPLEIQFLHISDDGKYLILASLFRIQKSDNAGFSPIAEALPLVKYQHSYANTSNPINLMKFFNAKSTPVYYKYDGSSTVPPCTENVTWLVCIGAAKIGTAQLVKLREVQSVEKANESAECSLMDNFRPLQDINGRKIYRPA